MLMLWVTKVFHTGPTRVGRLSKNIVLPRSVPLPVIAAVPVGALLGLICGLLLAPLLDWLTDSATIIGTLMILGGALSAALVSFQPWRGEHVHTVAAVRFQALTSAKSLICPGAGMPTVRSEDVGTLVCCECGRVFSSAELFAPTHQWRRRVYVGMQPIPPPATGEVQIISGSVPSWEQRRRSRSPFSLF